MDAKDPEERHDSFAGSTSEAEASSASSDDKPIVILVIGDCPTLFAYLAHSHSELNMLREHQ